MARLEMDGRFVELWLADGETWPELWRRQGAIGDDDAPAERVELDHMFRAARRFTELLGEHLRTGWNRVADPARETPDGHESWDPRLAADLHAGDLDAALVLGDTLQERGHPRGALIAIQRAREDRPDDPELATREANLLEEHAQILLGPLAAAVGERGSHHEKVLVLSWRRGFVERARIDGFHAHGESEQVLWELFRHPSGRFLRELDIGCHHAGDQDNTLMVDLLVSAEPAPPLRRLFVGDFDDTGVDQIDISRAYLGDATGLGGRYPQLEDVVLKGRGDVVLGDLVSQRPPLRDPHELAVPFDPGVDHRRALAGSRGSRAVVR
jgi:hypothetical protein